LFPLSPKPYFSFYLVRSSISENEERRVKARHDVTQFYQRRKLVSRRELPQADMTIEDNSSLAREEDSSEDDDVEDDTYMPSLRAPICGRGKGLASRSGSGSGAAEEEAFDVEEITPTSYVHMTQFRLESKGQQQGQTRFSEGKEEGRFEDFYESVIIPKNKSESLSQWIYWNYMEGKHDRVFDEVVVACKAKHLRDIMTFRKN
jgi:hypothetical protein